MIKKIIVLMILLLISINNVNCDTNGSVRSYISTELNYNTLWGGDTGYSGNKFILELNQDTSGKPDYYKISDVHMWNTSNYTQIPGNLGDSFNIYYSNDGIELTEHIGYGSILVNKKSYVGVDLGHKTVLADIYFFFDIFNYDTELSGKQYYILSSAYPAIYSHYNKFVCPSGEGYINQYYAANKGVITGYPRCSFTKNTNSYPNYEFHTLGLFRNDYDITNYPTGINFNITRLGMDETPIYKSSNILMRNSTTDEKYYQSSSYIINTSHYLLNGTFNYYIVREIDDYEYLIYTSEEEEEEEEEQPTLTTDKTYYNTSELINISFTNIDTIYNQCTESICETPYELHILYPVTEQYNQYRSKYIYPLTYNLEDETIILSTSFLSPQNNYILGIVGINGYYGLHDDILLFSDDFVVYPDEEYLSVSCDSETTCYTYNNVDITIYYQINNNSNIIIKDNDNNVINTYYNIIGNGSILYHIPDDLYYENTYPNWKVYLNNTEYSTSFNKGVTVYWSQFATPTPTPTYTPTPTPDINISDEIDNLKDEISPIKDLFFGLSEIVIDNPDYNKDNIVDENEINHWFNSLIPMCIILLLIILYIGLKKNRND